MKYLVLSLLLLMLSCSDMFSNTEYVYMLDGELTKEVLYGWWEGNNGDTLVFNNANLYSHKNGHNQQYSGRWEFKDSVLVLMSDISWEDTLDGYRFHDTLTIPYCSFHRLEFRGSRVAQYWRISI